MQRAAGGVGQVAHRVHDELSLRDVVLPVDRELNQGAAGIARREKAKCVSGTDCSCVGGHAAVATTRWLQRALGKPIEAAPVKGHLQGLGRSTSTIGTPPADDCNGLSDKGFSKGFSTPDGHHEGRLAHADGA